MLNMTTGSRNKIKEQQKMSGHRNVRRLFGEHGYTIERVRSGKHLIVWAERDGKVQRFTLPRTPSDHRSQRNLEADLKRGYPRPSNHEA